jgi:uncharacterized repeat protein (TIGR01451 family)
MLAFSRRGSIAGLNAILRKEQEMKRRFFPAFVTVVVLLCAAHAFGATSTPTPTRSTTPTPTPTSNRTADLSVAKVASPSPARVGQDLTYTLTVHNNGPNFALDFSLTDFLPANVVFVSASLSDPSGSCFHSGGTVSCFLNILFFGPIKAVIVVKPTSVGSLTNSAVVHSAASEPLRQHDGRHDRSPGADDPVVLARQWQSCRSLS